MENVLVLFIAILTLSIVNAAQDEHLSQSKIHPSKLQSLLFAPFHRASFGGTHRFEQLKDEPASGESWGLSNRKSKEKPCCYPKVWQGQMYRYASLQDIEYALTFYEDDQNQKLAIDIVETPGNSTTPTKYSQIVQMDSTGTKCTIYQFDKAAKKCSHRQFNNVTYDQLTEHCVPDDAFYAGEFPMGIPKGGSSFNVRSWMWKPLPKELPDVHYERLVSSDCAPVLGITRGTLPGNQLILQSDYYFNIQTSITDPSVFNVPDYCKTSSTLLDITAEHFNVFMGGRYLRKQKGN